MTELHTKVTNKGNQNAFFEIIATKEIEHARMMERIMERMKGKGQ